MEEIKRKLDDIIALCEKQEMSKTDEKSIQVILLIVRGCLEVKGFLPILTENVISFSEGVLVPLATKMKHKYQSMFN